MEVCKQSETIKPSLLAICRYLKLEVKRGSDFGKVTFCGNCKRVVGRLSELCRELEVVTMRVLEELRTFDRILEAGMQLEEMRVAGDSRQEERMSFKRKIKKTSDAKINRTFPKVSIVKQKIFRNLNSDIVSKFPTQHTQTSLKNNSLLPRLSSGFMPRARYRIGKNHKPCPRCTKWIHKAGHWRHINWVCGRKATQPVKPSVQEHLSDSLSLVDPLKAVEEPLEQKPTLPIQVAVPARLRLPFGSKLTKRSKLTLCDLCGKKILRHNLLRHKNLYCKLTAGNKKPGIAKQTPIVPTPVSVPANVNLISGSRPVNKSKLVACDLCGKQVTGYNLKRHKQLTCKLGPRLKDRWYNVRCACDICGKEFKYYPNLYKHKRAGTCKQAQASGLTSGVIQIENAENPPQEPDCSNWEQPPIVPKNSKAKRPKIKCDLCGVMLHHTGLARHKKQVHNPDGASGSDEQVPPPPIHASIPCKSKLKECDLCGKQIVSRHLSRHRKFNCKLGPRYNEKGGACDICGLGFKHYRTLVRHKREVSCRKTLAQSVNGNSKVTSDKEHPSDKGRALAGPETPIKIDQCSIQDELTYSLSVADPLAVLDEPEIRSGESMPPPPIKVSVPVSVSLPFGARTLKSKLARCDLCGNQIVSNHLSRHRKFHCRLGPRLKDPRYIRSSITHKTVTIKTPKRKCDLCGKLLSSHHLWLHKKVSCKMGPRRPCEERRTLTCAICGREYKHYRNLIQHKRAGSCKGALKQPVNEYCKQVLQRHQNLDCCPTQQPAVTLEFKDPLQEPESSIPEQTPVVPIQMVASATVKPPKVKCDLCGVMVYYFNLPRHKRQVHKPEGAPSNNPVKLPRRKCDACGVEFHSNSLSRHKNKHCKGSESPATAYPHSLPQHEKNHFTATSAENPVQGYPCDICGLEFQFPSNLSLHKEACHAEGATSMNTDILRNLRATPQQREVKVETATMITGDIFDPDDDV